MEQRTREGSGSGLMGLYYHPHQAGLKTPSVLAAATCPDHASALFPLYPSPPRLRLLLKAHDTQSVGSRMAEGGAEAREGTGDAEEVLGGAGGSRRRRGEGAPS